MKVQAAATAVDEQLQAKVERYDISGRDLAAQAFSADPAAVGRPRLRFADFQPGSLDDLSHLDDTRNFAIGCAQATGNIATHRSTELDEQVGLEQIAALSVLARWVESAHVETQ